MRMDSDKLSGGTWLLYHVIGANVAGFGVLIRHFTTDSRWCSSIYRIAISEYVAIASRHILAAARDGRVGVSSTDIRMGGKGPGVLVQSPLYCLP